MKNNFNQQCITYSQMNLIFNSRIYFRRLVTWTRAYLLSRYLGIGTAEDAFGRLYLEALDLGNMLEIIFGSELANKDAQQAGQYAIIIRDLISAQLTGNTEEVSKHVRELYQNAADRAAFAEAVNPFWNKDELTKLLNNYIQYTLEEANALVTGNYSTEFEPYERLTALTEQLGDFVAQGLYEYITSGTQSTAVPSKNGCITYDQLNTIYRIRMFWYELVSLVRNYMISRYKGLGKPAEEFYFNELKRVADNYATALKTIFGDRVPQNYVQLFYTYFDLIDEFVTAQMQNNTDEINRVTKLLYQNADERAAAITSINPEFWNETEWRDRLYNNLRTTFKESTSFLEGDYAKNIDVFNTLLGQAESTGNYFTQGLLQYLASTQQK